MAVYEEIAKGRVSVKITVERRITIETENNERFCTNKGVKCQGEGLFGRRGQMVQLPVRSCFLYLNRGRRGICS